MINVKNQNQSENTFVGHLPFRRATLAEQKSWSSSGERSSLLTAFTVAVTKLHLHIAN
jgi:hypothetical protein